MSEREHAADGQEWASVFLLNAVDGCLPSDLATGSTPEIEEERRLLYVAMTRAKEQLHLMVPQRFFTHGQRSTGDRHVYAQRTRFIPNSMLDHFESRKDASNVELTSLCETRRYQDQQLTPVYFMSIETIGEAHSLGWRVIARCAYSRGDGPSSKSSRECIYRKELDMETLVWTAGEPSRCRAWKAA
jgi:hypothetical protein